MLLLLLIHERKRHSIDGNVTLKLNAYFGSNIIVLSQKISPVAGLKIILRSSDTIDSPLYEID